NRSFLTPKGPCAGPFFCIYSPQPRSNSGSHPRGRSGLAHLPLSNNNTPLGSHSMHLNELKALHVSEVLKQAEELEIENTGRMRKQELMFDIIKKRARAGEQVFADGVLEILPDGFGFLRSPDTSYTASTDDIYISPSQVRRFNLHTGDMIEGEVRTPKDGERYFALTKLDKVNGGLPEDNKHKIMFENLTPLFPREQMRLERDGLKSEENITGRVIDIIAPIGK